MTDNKDILKQTVYPVIGAKKIGLPKICNFWEEEEVRPLHLLHRNLIMDRHFRRSTCTRTRWRSSSPSATSPSTRSSTSPQSTKDNRSTISTSSISASVFLGAPSVNRMQCLRWGERVHPRTYYQNEVLVHVSRIVPR